MNRLPTFGGGLTGAIVLTLLHQVLKGIDPKAPRMDLLGMNALSKLLKSFGQNLPDVNKLYAITMAGDIISNALYYSLAGIGGKKKILIKGVLLGIAAGVGAVVLPKPLGLQQAHSNRTEETKIMTIALYLFGGLAAAGAIKLLERSNRK
jgi:hypothetical protein